MTDSNAKKPDDAVFWCPEHGDDHLQANAVENIFGAIDCTGMFFEEIPEDTIYRKVWCDKCNRTVKQQYVLVVTKPDDHFVWKVSVEALQDIAEEKIGRRLKKDELYNAVKGISSCLSITFCDSATDAIADVVSDS